MSRLRWETLAKVRLPLTIDERLTIIRLLEQRYDGRLYWTQKPPHPNAKWFIVSRRRS